MIDREPNFSKWRKWEDRNESDLQKPGIYMLAITEEDLEDTNVKFKDVIYIGMTKAIKGIKGRLGQFNNSINGIPQHSFGNRIYDKLKYPYENWEKKLFFCVHIEECNVKKPRKPEDLIKMGIISYLEYKALANFTKEMGKEPKGNKA